MFSAQQLSPKRIFKCKRENFGEMGPSLLKKISKEENVIKEEAQTLLLYWHTRHLIPWQKVLIWLRLTGTYLPLELFSGSRSWLVLAHVVSCCVYEMSKILIVYNGQYSNFFDDWANKSLHFFLLKSSMVRLYDATR